MPRQWKRVTPEVRREIIHMAAQGMSVIEIGQKLGRPCATIYLVVQPLGGVIRREMWDVSSKSLSLDERVEIKLGLEGGLSQRAIARKIGRDPSTVSRELNRNGGPTQYAPMKAHRWAYERARRPKTTKLASNPFLCARVVSDLEKFWSPEEISQRLKEDFGDDMSMQISHETIYKTLFVQGRGELRRELARCLRTGRAKRVSRNRIEKRGRIADMVMISERPAEVEDRAVPGHWEGDLVMGKDNKSAIGTLVERTTRFVMLFPLLEDHTAEVVREAITKTIRTLPESLRRSLTWDQGGEMSEHMRFKVDTGVEVYFCDPHSPWQRGSNENTNGLLRQYFPKGQDLRNYTPKQIQDAADGLNGRPRKTLGWRTPAEKFDEIVARTG